MDPMERLQIAADTSFAFMLAAAAQDLRIFQLLPGDIMLRDGKVWLRGQFVAVRDKEGDHFNVIEEALVCANDCAAVFIRTDPPFDENYLTCTWLLSFAERQGVRVVNSPAGIRSANEKLYALEFPELCPETIVTNCRNEALSFIEHLGGEAIAKPLDGHGGFGVVRVATKDSNTRAIFDLLTQEEKVPILLQAFIPEAAQGDKRVILVDGKIRGGVVRVPTGGDHRGNVHVGGRVEPSEITAVDRRIEAAIGQRLRDDGLYFVGIDVIGDKLIEVNVTSPTLVREIQRLGGPDIATEVIRSLF